MFGVGRRGAGDPRQSSNIAMRMSAGPLGQWERPSIQHGHLHADTVSVQFKMVQCAVTVCLWVVTCFIFFKPFRYENELLYSLLLSTYLLFSSISMKTCTIQHTGSRPGKLKAFHTRAYHSVVPEAVLTSFRPTTLSLRLILI